MALVAASIVWRVKPYEKTHAAYLRPNEELEHEIYLLWLKEEPAWSGAIFPLVLLAIWFGVLYLSRLIKVIISTQQYCHIFPIC